MGKYLDILQRREAQQGCDKSDISDKRYFRTGGNVVAHNPRYTFGRINRFCRTFQELERRRPDYIDHASWQAAVEDGRRFLAKWAQRADALGWTVRDLFGLHKSPEKPGQSYRRMTKPA